MLDPQETAQDVRFPRHAVGIADLDADDAGIRRDPDVVSVGRSTVEDADDVCAMAVLVPDAEAGQVYVDAGDVWQVGVGLQSAVEHGHSHALAGGRLDGVVPDLSETDGALVARQERIGVDLLEPDGRIRRDVLHVRVLRQGAHCLERHVHRERFYRVELLLERRPD